MKDILFVVALLVAVSVAIVFVRMNEDISKRLNDEKYNRLYAEESSLAYAKKIKIMESDLKAAQDKIEKIQSLVDQQKNLNNDLKTQFEKISKAKADLEGKLKETLAQPPVQVLTNQQVN